MARSRPESAEQIRVGGEQGQTLEVTAGDVIMIPAGVPHQNVGSSPDFGAVGAYPEGRGWDVLRALEGERPEADRKIAHLPIPKTIRFMARMAHLNSFGFPPELRAERIVSDR